MFYWWKVQKKKTVYWSLKHWIYFTPVQASLLNSFFKILNYTCRCSWSEVCMILAFPPHPLAHLLFSDNLLQSSVNSNFWLIGSWLHSQRSCIYNGPVYSGHPETVTDQLPKNFQLAYIFCNVDLYIAVILHLTITLPFPKSDHCTQVWLCVLLHWILPRDTKIGTKNLLDSFQIEMFSSEWIQLLCMSL